MATRIVEFWFLQKARIYMLAGKRERARAALKAALGRNPNGFVAHFLLAKAYLRDRSIVKAKREFDVAWQIDPARFESAYAKLRAQHDGIPELFAYTGGRRGPRVVNRYRTEYYGDFRNEGERRDFQDLPPITRVDILGIDWDRFEEEIRDEEHRG